LSVTIDSSPAGGKSFFSAFDGEGPANVAGKPSLNSNVPARPKRKKGRRAPLVPNGVILAEQENEGTVLTNSQVTLTFPGPKASRYDLQRLTAIQGQSTSSNPSDTTFNQAASCQNLAFVFKMNETTQDKIEAVINAELQKDNPGTDDDV